MYKILILIFLILLILTSCVQFDEEPEKTPELMPFNSIDNIADNEYLLKITPIFNDMYIKYNALNTKDCTKLNEQLKEIDILQKEFEGIDCQEKYKNLFVKMKEVNLYWHNISTELEEIGNGKLNFNPLLDNLYQAKKTLEESKNIIGGGTNEAN